MAGIWNNIKTVILLGSLTGLFLLVGALIGGTSGLIIGFALALIMNFISYWFSDKIVLMMYSAKPVTKKQMPNLYRIVEDVCKEAQLPLPKIYLVPTMTPNAFATGRNPNHAAVAVTQGIINLLDHNELKGVIAHEISHIKNRDILISSVAATIAGAISFIAMMVRFSAIFGGGGNDKDNNGGLLGLIVIGIITPIIAMLIQLAISRSREYLADSTGAKLSNPKYLADALEKLEKGNKDMPMRDAQPSTAHMFITNPLTAGGIMSLLSTHPPMKERVRRLREMKD